MTPHRRPIRVLNVIARLNIGGPTIHVSLLTARMSAPEYESRLVAGTVGPGEGDMQYFADRHGVTATFIPELGPDLHLVHDLVTTWKLYVLMREFKPDVVHTHTAKAGFVGRIAARLAGVPVVVHTFHGHVFRGYFGPVKTNLFIVLERFAARLSDRIITLTERLRRELADTYGITNAARIAVVPYGIVLDEFVRKKRKEGSFRTEWNIPEEAPLIGLVGRLVPVKNHALFVEAAARVHKVLPDARFIMAGSGELRDHVEARIDALGLRGVAQVTGWYTDVAAVYSDLDVKVISSNNEGTPFTLIEAMAAGCPVVSTAVGGVPDFLEHGKLGALVPPGDPDALAEAIIDTLKNPPDMASIRQIVIDRYGIERLVRDLDSLYRDLLTRRETRESPGRSRPATRRHSS